MSYLSANDSIFLSTVEAWLKQQGEVGALIHFSSAGGAKSFEFFYSLQEFKARLNELPSKTWIDVFEDKQLPLRGKVDEQFIDLALREIPEHENGNLVTGLDLATYGAASWHHFLWGNDLEDLRENLEFCRDQRVAVGIFPWWIDNPSQIVSAIVPEADGSLIVGIY